ncbi:MAG: response regulator transcription factor [Chloroflexi bacterium]|nr:response regulator transcription factor [Chloroflexota bacterium]
MRMGGLAARRDAYEAPRFCLLSIASGLLLLGFSQVAPRLARDPRHADLSLTWTEERLRSSEPGPPTIDLNHPGSEVTVENRGVPTGAGRQTARRVRVGGPLCGRTIFGSTAFSFSPAHLSSNLASLQSRKKPDKTRKEGKRMRSVVRESPAQRDASVIKDDLLTPREMEVLHLLALGLTDREIAETLVISERTVHKHVENIRAKLGARTRTGVVAEARRRGLLKNTQNY